MKKRIATTLRVAFPFFVKSTRMKTYVWISVVLSVGCTATQVRWDATKMRKDVMVYYNDQIMDNLIRAKKHLPFVHVDITLLTSQGASQISGTIGAGETRTHNDSGPIGIFNNVAKTVTRPFSWSVTPQQTETLTISAAPALGSLALTSPPTESATPAPTPEVTKTTITYDPHGNEISTIEEETLKPRPTPTPGNIYDLYEKYAKCPPGGVLSESSVRPREGEYVPGTLKRWGTQCYYYVPRGSENKYYKFCRELFTRGQPGSLEKAFLQNQAASLAVPAR